MLCQVMSRKGLLELQRQGDTWEVAGSRLQQQVRRPPPMPPLQQRQQQRPQQQQRQPPPLARAPSGDDGERWVMS